MRLEGLRELDQALKELGTRVGGRILRGAVMTAAKIMEAKAKEYAQRYSRSGALVAAIGKKVGQDTLYAIPGKKFLAQVGPLFKNNTAIALYNLAYKRKVRGIYHGHLVERGFRHVGRAAQQTQPRAFMVPALNASRVGAVTAFKEYASKAVRRAVERRMRGPRR